MASALRFPPSWPFPDDRIDHGSGWIEVVRAAEKHPAFEDLMELPLALRVQVRLFGPTIETASGAKSN